MVYSAQKDHLQIAALLHDWGLFELKLDIEEWILQYGSYPPEYDPRHVCHAKELFVRSMEMVRRLLGENCGNEEVAVSLFQLGVIAEKIGDVSEAEHCYRSRLAMKRRLYGDNALN